MSKFFSSVLIFIVISCILPARVNAQYKITGLLNNYDSLWTNRILLSACDSTKHINFCSSEIVINKDSTDKEGHFTLSGNNLPDENLIYRIDLTNNKQAYMLSNFNHIYVILNNHSSIKITCNNFSRSPFDYEVEGSAENSTLQKLEKYLAEQQNLLYDPNSKTGTAKKLAWSRYNTNIRSYCDTCKYAIVALMGINEINDFAKDYAEHNDFYQRLLNRIKLLPEANSIYVKEFEEKLSYFDNKNQAGSFTGKYLTNPLLYIAGLIILFLLGFVWYLTNKIKRSNTNKTSKPEPNRSELIETLTRREKEILALLIEDIQNKEIANKLNLEVSTIKTHISNIYQKLAISKRNEVKAYRSFLNN
jgi:DNA-binding CsgD family transcriptional regulator